MMWRETDTYWQLRLFHTQIPIFTTLKTKELFPILKHAQKQNTEMQSPTKLETNSFSSQPPNSILNVLVYSFPFKDKTFFLA